MAPKLCVTCIYRTSRFCTHGNSPDLVEGGLELGDPAKYCREQRQEGAACGPDAINHVIRPNKASPTALFLDCVNRIADGSSNDELAKKLGMQIGKAIAESLINLSNRHIEQAGSRRNADPI